MNHKKKSISRVKTHADSITHTRIIRYHAQNSEQRLETRTDIQNSVGGYRWLLKRTKRKTGEHHRAKARAHRNTWNVAWRITSEMTPYCTMWFIYSHVILTCDSFILTRESFIPMILTNDPFVPFDLWFVFHMWLLGMILPPLYIYIFIPKSFSHTSRLEIHSFI